MSGKNPKDLAAETRVPLHALPAAGRIAGAMACAQGMRDYGLYNWRERPISLLEYTGAIERHLLQVRDGEDIDPRSLTFHLGHIIATASIILDAQGCGTLNDDRVGRGPAPRMIREGNQLLEERARGAVTMEEALANIKSAARPALQGGARGDPGAGGQHRGQGHRRGGAEVGDQ